MKLTDKKSLFEQVTAAQLRQNLVILQAKTIKMPRMWILELCGAIEAQQQENERLKAQNGAMREALETPIKSLESYGSHDNPISPWSLISQARQVITTPTTYHNPADVEALKLARGVLDDCKHYGLRVGAFVDIVHAIEAIDKAVGE
jgi:hypothetical protein